MTMILFAVLLGLGAGILVNYLSDVLPARRRLTKPFCLKCENDFPAINYFFWPWKCPNCGQRRSLRVWFVDIVAIGATVWLWQSPLTNLGFWPAWLLLIYFGVVVVIDIEHRLILHPVSLVGAVLTLTVGISLHGVWESLLGGLGGFGIMFGIYLFGILFMIVIARLRNLKLSDYEALGFGDVILSAVLGFLLGWPGIIGGLLLAILLGGAVSILYLVFMLVVRRYRSFAAIPYGPFLVGGAVILIYFGRVLLSVIE